MKLIQFVHPMFLAALGIHLSLMFVPIGDGDAEPELLEEDVPLAELTGDARRAVNSVTPERLPVPDINSKPAPRLTSRPTPRPASRPASRPAPKPPTTRVAPPAITAAQPAKKAATGTLAASGPSSSDGTATRGAASGNDSNAQNTRNVATPDVSSAPQEPVSSTSDSAADNENADSETIGGLQENSTSSPTASGTTLPIESPKLAKLVGALPSSAVLPRSLENMVLALQDALLYRPEGTTDESAAQMREGWISTVSRQASGDGRVERAVPKVDDSLKLTYPIAAAVVREGRSLDVCLDENPSNVELGLLFDSEGELFIEPTVLRSAGYKALDREAIAMVQKEENLPSDRSIEAYIFEIEVDYDQEACINPF